MRSRVLVPAVLLVSLAAVVVGTYVLRHENGRPTGLRELVGNAQPIYCGGGTGPYVALTFDDGPTRWTPELLRVLRANGARATFFEIGEHAAGKPALVRSESAAGEVGDHTWSHPPLVGLDRSRVLTEIERAKQTIERLSGRPVFLVRPPFGAHDALVDDVARQLGLLEVLWNVDSGDASAASTPSSAVIARQLAKRVRPGAIVLLHEDETVPAAVGAMHAFLPELRRRGLKAVTVSELLRLDPPAPGSIGNVGGCNSTWRRTP